MLHDSAAPAEEVLRLDAGSLDLARHRGRAGPPWPGSWVEWAGASTELLRWLTAGRPEGPVFLTTRRAPAGTPAPDVCPLTGRGRLSYRRAAEVFTEVTRPLDPAGRGWSLSSSARSRPGLARGRTGACRQRIMGMRARAGHGTSRARRGRLTCPSRAHLS